MLLNLNLISELAPLQMGLRLRQMSGAHLGALYRKATEDDDDNTKKQVRHVRLLFDDRVAERVENNLRALPTAVKRSALELVSEFYREGFDPNAVLEVSMHLVGAVQARP